jgi:hypothetical protein
LDSLYEPTFGLQKIAFYDAMNGVAVGQRGKLLLTNNGGKTWFYDKLPQHMIDKEPLTMNITWAGKTPIVGTWYGDIYRYEGDYFKFLPEPEPVATIYPENNSSKISFSDLEFQWNLKEGYNRYYFQLSESPDFKNLQNEERIENQSITIDKLNDFTEYYWRVAFKFDKKFIWSAPVKFRTKMPLISTTAPECGATEQELKVNFTWDEVKGAEYYRIMISTDPTFADDNIEYEGITGTSFEVPDLDELTMYYWKVQPYRTDEIGDWSNVCDFKTKKSTSVRYSEEDRGIRIKPNPAGDFITITELNNGLQPIVHKVQIFDVLGIEVMYESILPMTSSHQMNVEKLPAGIYFIRIGYIVEKFVKM